MYMQPRSIYYTFRYYRMRTPSSTDERSYGDGERARKIVPNSPSSNGGKNLYIHSHKL